jgi:hypothetical protein
MPSLLAYAAPVALLVPAMGVGLDAIAADTSTIPVAADYGETSEPTREVPSEKTVSQPSRRASNPLSAFHDSQVARQVRIEQRVVVRIAPRPATKRQSLLARLPKRELDARYEEREMDGCVAVEKIAGVQTGSGNRLLFFLSDRRTITVNLEKSCHARDFYSGFYVERREDGKLCVDRDKIKSRTGV